MYFKRDTLGTREPSRKAELMPKSVKPSKGWATGAWTKEKKVPGILRLELYPTLEAMLTPPRQYTRHPKPSGSNRPVSLDDGVHPASFHLTFGFEQEVVESWMPCSDGVALSDALPQQSQVRPFVHPPLAIRLSEPQISAQSDERLETYAQTWQHKLLGRSSPSCSPPACNGVLLVCGARDVAMSILTGSIG
jgi:hypothetical protein